MNAPTSPNHLSRDEILLALAIQGEDPQASRVDAVRALIDASALPVGERDEAVRAAVAAACQRLDARSADRVAPLGTRDVSGRMFAWTGGEHGYLSVDVVRDVSDDRSNTTPRLPGERVFEVCYVDGPFHGQYPTLAERHLFDSVPANEAEHTQQIQRYETAAANLGRQMPETRASSTTRREWFARVDRECGHLPGYFGGVIPAAAAPGGELATWMPTDVPEFAHEMGALVKLHGSAMAIQINVDSDKPFRALHVLYEDGRGVGSQWAATPMAAVAMVADAQAIYSEPRALPSDNGGQLPVPSKYRDGTEHNPIGLEIGQLPLLGVARIDSVGEENIYIVKSGLHYYCKVMATEAYAPGEWDFVHQRKQPVPALPAGADLHRLLRELRAAFVVIGNNTTDEAVKNFAHEQVARFPLPLIDRIASALSDRAVAHDGQSVSAGNDLLRGTHIADALETCDWSAPSIGNQAILRAAVDALRSAPGAMPEHRQAQQPALAIPPLSVHQRIYLEKERDGSVRFHAMPGIGEANVEPAILARMNVMLDAATDAAIHAGCAGIQNAMGVSHGDLAGRWFSEESIRAQFADQFGRYALAEQRALTQRQESRPSTPAPSPDMDM